MKSVKILLLAFGLILITAGASFAQVSFIAGSSANQIAPNAQTGLAGTITLNPTAAGSIPAGESMNISFAPYTISSPSDLTIAIGGTPAVCSFSGFTAYNTALPTQVCNGGTVTVTASQTSITIAVSVAPMTIPPPQWDYWKLHPDSGSTLGCSGSESCHREQHHCVYFQQPGAGHHD